MVFWRKKQARGQGAPDQAAAPAQPILDIGEISPPDLADKRFEKKPPLPDWINDYISRHVGESFVKEVPLYPKENLYKDLYKNIHEDQHQRYKNALPSQHDFDRLMREMEERKRAEDLDKICSGTDFSRANGIEAKRLWDSLSDEKRAEPALSEKYRKWAERWAVITLRRAQSRRASKRNIILN